jgi:hypothetical protein
MKDLTPLLNVVLDPQGNVLVFGYVSNAFGSTDFMPAKHSPAGDTLVRGSLSLSRSGHDSDSRSGIESCLHLLDVAGRKVLELHSGENDVTSLTPGVYFVSGIAVTRQRLVVPR